MVRISFTILNLLTFFSINLWLENRINIRFNILYSREFSINIFTELLSHILESKTHKKGLIFIIISIIITDGYSMADIQYKWGIDCTENCPEPVELAKNLELPQFKVIGHKQTQKIETLTTGMENISNILTIPYTEFTE